MNMSDHETTDRHELLRYLVEYRKKIKMRQIDVAEAMGIGQPAVSELERGETSPRAETLLRYAKAIGVNIHMRIEPDEEAEDNE